MQRQRFIIKYLTSKRFLLCVILNFYDIMLIKWEPLQLKYVKQNIIFLILFEEEMGFYENKC